MTAADLLRAALTEDPGYTPATFDGSRIHLPDGRTVQVFGEITKAEDDE